MIEHMLLWTQGLTCICPWHQHSGSCMFISAPDHAGSYMDVHCPWQSRAVQDRLAEATKQLEQAEDKVEKSGGCAGQGNGGHGGRVVDVQGALDMYCHATGRMGQHFSALDSTVRH